MNNPTIRIHIYTDELHLKENRTTTSMYKIIFDLMAIKLGELPGSKQAHNVVRKKVQLFWDELPKEDKKVSAQMKHQKLNHQVCLFIADKRIADKYRNLTI
jgi:hypothetical protein